MSNKFENMQKNFLAIVNNEQDKQLFGNYHVEKYKQIAKIVGEKYSLKNMFQIPNISRIIINCGPLRDGAVDQAASFLELVTGQLSVKTKARRSIAQKKSKKRYECWI